MMSKKKWFLVLCIFILYLLLGAAIFHIVESEEELKRAEMEEEKKEKLIDAIDGLFERSEVRRKINFVKKLQDYCDKSFSKTDDEPRLLWDFYHSVFFVITVVSTIGYGNLAPTTMFTRIFMIFYGLIGIPMNGIVMVTLGTYFGRSFTKLYHRWKTSKVQYDTTRLGLISQIILYLVPGFTFFIFLPSAFMMLFENWDYDVAVYYCFVTLTTIGFGDYVAGVNNVNDFKSVPYWIYKISLLVWIIIGLGYVVMILGFITQALQSKKMHRIEEIIKHNIKRTPIRIRQELRAVLQEFLSMKVKQSYKGEFVYVPSLPERSQSCPDLSMSNKTGSTLTTARKRALSECPHHLMFQSENDLEHVEEDSAKSELLIQVVDALSLLEDQDDLGGGYDGLSDSQILESERYGSKWSLKSQNFTPKRRAISDVRAPTMNKVEARQDLPWFGQETSNYPTLFQRKRTLSVPSDERDKSQNFITRIKNKFISPKEDKALDVEQNRRRASMFTPSEDRYLRQTNRGRASVLSIQQQQLLEQTSVANLIRALSDVMLQPPGPKRKLGTAGLTPPKTQSPPRARRPGIRPNLQTRRTSLMPDSHVLQNERRRLSLRPVEENLLAPPPYPAQERPPRKFSKTSNLPSITISPVQRQLNKKDNNKDES